MCAPLGSPVQVGIDEVFWCGLEEGGKLTAVAIRVVLVNHGDLHPCLLRTSNLCCKSFAFGTQISPLVEVQQEVRRLRVVPSSAFA